MASGAAPHLVSPLEKVRRDLPLACSPFARLAVFALLMLSGASLLVWLGADWKLWVERLTELHPLLFLAAIGLLPVAGFPISAFYFYAGVAYGWQTGILLCLSGLAINMTLSYFVALTLLRSPLRELARRRGYELPQLNTAAGQFRATFLIRTVPGPPFPVQNYLLALAGIPFSIYLPVSLATQGTIGGLLVFSSGLLARHVEPWVLIAGAIVFFIAAGALGSAFFKRREKRPETCSSP